MDPELDPAGFVLWTYNVFVSYVFVWISCPFPPPKGLPKCSDHFKEDGKATIWSLYAGGGGCWVDSTVSQGNTCAFFSMGNCRAYSMQQVTCACARISNNVLTRLNESLPSLHSSAKAVILEHKFCRHQNLSNEERPIENKSQISYQRKQLLIAVLTVGSSHLPAISNWDPASFELSVFLHIHRKTIVLVGLLVTWHKALFPLLQCLGHTGLCLRVEF